MDRRAMLHDATELNKYVSIEAAAVQICIRSITSCSFRFSHKHLRCFGSRGGPCQHCSRSARPRRKCGSAIGIYHLNPPLLPLQSLGSCGLSGAWQEVWFVARPCLCPQILHVRGHHGKEPAHCFCIVTLLEKRPNLCRRFCGRLCRRKWVGRRARDPQTWRYFKGSAGQPVGTTFYRHIKHLDFRFARFLA